MHCGRSNIQCTCSLNLRSSGNCCNSIYLQTLVISAPLYPSVCFAISLRSQSSATLTPLRLMSNKARRPFAVGDKIKKNINANNWEDSSRHRVMCIPQSQTERLLAKISLYRRCCITKSQIYQRNTSLALSINKAFHIPAPTVITIYTN